MIEWYDRILILNQAISEVWVEGREDRKQIHYYHNSLKVMLTQRWIFQWNFYNKISSNTISTSLNARQDNKHTQLKCTFWNQISSIILIFQHWGLKPFQLRVILWNRSAEATRFTKVSRSVMSCAFFQTTSSTPKKKKSSKKPGCS